MEKQAIIDSLMSGITGAADVGLKTFNTVKDLVGGVSGKSLLIGAPLLLGTPFLAGYGLGRVQDHVNMPQAADVPQLKRESVSNEYSKAIKAIQRRLDAKKIAEHTEELENEDTQAQLGI